MHLTSGSRVKSAENVTRSRGQSTVNEMPVTARGQVDDNTSFLAFRQVEQATLFEQNATTGRQGLLFLEVLIVVVVVIRVSSSSSSSHPQGQVHASPKGICRSSSSNSIRILTGLFPDGMMTLLLLVSTLSSFTPSLQCPEGGALDLRRSGQNVESSTGPHRNVGQF